jgi:hypothetical protein
LHIDADANRFCPFACSAFWTPRHLLDNQFDRLQPPLVGYVVAVTHADQLITIPLTEFFCAFLAGLQGDLGTHSLYLSGK